MHYNSFDQLNRPIRLDSFPRRIVSLVPSQTELLFDLGLGEEIVGITKFCIHPAGQFRKKEKVGGTKNLKSDRIEALQPDLLIGNKEENRKEQIEHLAQRYPVWVSDVQTLDDALDMIRKIGELTGKEDRAKNIASDIFDRFHALPSFPILPAAYFIWHKPDMVAASGTFIDEMLRRAGFANVFGHLQRYPEISPRQLQEAAPRVILLSSEPYPFKEEHVAAFQEICPTAVITQVDGEMFSWYGSRLLLSPAYFRNLRAELDHAILNRS